MTKSLLLFSALIALSACNSTSENHQESSQESSQETRDLSNQVVCSAPPPVHNIWALEPMLVKKGLISEEMNEAQKEQVIRQYIEKKSEQYNSCKKGK